MYYKITKHIKKFFYDLVLKYWDVKITLNILFEEIKKQHIY